MKMHCRRKYFEEFQMLDDGRTNVESDEYGDNEDDWQFYNDL